MTEYYPIKIQTVVLGETATEFLQDLHEQLILIDQHYASGATEDYRSPRLNKVYTEDSPPPKYHVVLSYQSATNLSLFNRIRAYHEASETALNYLENTMYKEE